MILQAAAIEFHEGGDTIWVHAPDGSTTLRIKTKGAIFIEHCGTSPVSHADMIVDKDITICIGAEITPE